MSGVILVGEAIEGVSYWKVRRLWGVILKGEEFEGGQFGR